MLPPETEQEVVQLIRYMESYYQAAFDGFEEDVIFYEGLLDEIIEPPEGYDITIPTTARAVVDEAVDNVTPSDVIVFYPPRSIGETPEKNADEVRRFVRGMWLYWRQRSNDIDVVRDFLKNLFMSGKACFKVAPDWGLWPQLGEETEKELRAEGGHTAVMEAVEAIERVREDNFPIFCRSIPPNCIMEDPTVGGRKLWVIERYTEGLAEVRNLYSKDAPELLEGFWPLDFPVHELWTATYVNPNGKVVKGKHWVFVNWEKVREEDNPYDELPYVIKHSGFGREAYEGKPEYKAVGFYTRQTKSMFLAEARRFMQFDAIMSQVAYPIAFLPDDVTDEMISFSPGSVNYVPDSVMQNIGNVWLKAPIPDAEHLSSLQLIGNQIERGTVQRALRGAGVPGTDSAAQYGMIAGQAKTRIESAKSSTEEAMSEVSERALRFIDRIFKTKLSTFVGEDSARSHSIGPKEIKGHYRTRIQFQPNEDAVKERKLVLANDAISKGGLSRYDAYVFAGFENPWELIERKNADDLMQEPLIKRAMAKDVLKQWGIDADALELQERQEEAEKQRTLSMMAQMMNIGTPPGGEPMSPDGNPANMGQTPPALMPPEGMAPPGGPPPQMSGDMGAGLPLPGGAPPAAQEAPVAGMMRDLQSMAGGVQ